MGKGVNLGLLSAEVSAHTTAVPVAKNTRSRLSPTVDCMNLSVCGGTHTAIRNVAAFDA
jgi:hypothetical protein